MSYSILVPYDFEGAADGALAWAAELHRVAGGALTLLHIVRALPPIAALDLAALEYPSESERAAMLVRLSRAAAQHGVHDAQTRVISAPELGVAVVRTAEEIGSELIVMGTHGRTPVKRAFVGSVADYVMRNAACPVATLRVGWRESGG